MTRKINVLIIPRWYPREDKPVSGIFVHEFAKAISRYCNVAVMFGYEKPYIKGFYEIKHEKIDNIEIFYVPHKKIISSYLCYTIAMFLAFKNIKKEFHPDIIHVHVYTSGIVPLILKHIYKIPYVLTEHFKIVKSARITEKIKLVLAKMVFENAELLVHVSKFMAHYTERYGIKNRYVIVRNTVDTSLFCYNNSNKTPNSKIKHFIFVGNPTSRKGIDYLFEALSILKQKRDDFILDLVGEGEEYKKYKKMANKLNISDLVVFHGIKSKSEISKMMQKCHFLILPSLWENLPCVLIESIAAGLPVIATDVGGVREIVNKNNGIIVPPRDADKLASAIDFMLDNYSKYNRNKISEYGRKKFSYNAVGEKLHYIYKLVLNQKR